MISKLRLLLRVADLPADARLLRRIVRLVDGDVVFLLHALDQLFDQLVEFAFHLHLLQAVAHFFVEHLAVEQRLFEGAPQFVERLLAFRQFVPEVVVESALQKVVGERAEQVLHAHLAGRVGDVFGVADAFHRAAISSQLKPSDPSLPVAMRTTQLAQIAASTFSDLTSLGRVSSELSYKLASLLRNSDYG